MAQKGSSEIEWNWQKRILRPVLEIQEEREYLQNVEAISHPEDHLRAETYPSIG